MKVQPDGMFEFSDGQFIGGRSFLGMTRLMTGIQDYSEILRCIREGTGKTVDEYAQELVAPSGDGDAYDMMIEGRKEVDEGAEDEDPLMSFGKAVTHDRDSIKNEDIVRSLYRLVCGTIAQLTTLNCARHRVANLFFCGNFVENEVARFIITKECLIRTKGWIKKAFEGIELKIRFIKHGGHLGSLGAFMKAHELKQKTN